MVRHLRNVEVFLKLVLIFLYVLYVVLSYRGNPAFKSRIEAVERQCGDVPLKFCHVDDGRISIFSFRRIELPVLP